MRCRSRGHGASGGGGWWSGGINGHGATVPFASAIPGYHKVGGNKRRRFLPAYVAKRID